MFIICKNKRISDDIQNPAFGRLAICPAMIGTTVLCHRGARNNPTANPAMAMPPSQRIGGSPCHQSAGREKTHVKRKPIDRPGHRFAGGEKRLHGFPPVRKKQPRGEYSCRKKTHGQDIRKFHGKVHVIDNKINPERVGQSQQYVPRDGLKNPGQCSGAVPAQNVFLLREQFPYPVHGPPDLLRVGAVGSFFDHHQGFRGGDGVVG